MEGSLTAKAIPQKVHISQKQSCGRFINTNNSKGNPVEDSLTAKAILWKVN